MRYLLDHLDMLETMLAGKHILLLLDFDGTLSPIAATPDQATLPDGTRRELEWLVEIPGCSVAVISGRALSDIRGKIGIVGITYIGNHGLEMVRPNEEPKRIVLAQFQAILGRVKRELALRLAPFTGTIIEDKVFSLAVHYRMAGEGDRRLVKEAVRETVEAFGGEQEMAISAGAMVIELRPPLSRDKGTVVSEFIASETRRYDSTGTFAIYIGDDVTDEDAFKAIRGRGWGVLVGMPRISYAEYYLKDPGEVRALLHLLVERRGEGR